MTTSTATQNDGTLTGITTPCQSGHGSNGNEGVLHTPQIWSHTNRCMLMRPTSGWKGLTPPQRMQLVHSKAKTENVFERPSEK